MFALVVLWIRSIFATLGPPLANPELLAFVALCLGGEARANHTHCTARVARNFVTPGLRQKPNCLPLVVLNLGGKTKAFALIVLRIRSKFVTLDPLSANPDLLAFVALCTHCAARVVRNFVAPGLRC